jgi:hypothetical protein
MKNLSILADNIHELKCLGRDLGARKEIVATAFNPSFNRIYLLFKVGLVACYQQHDGFELEYTTVMKFEDVSELWFALDFVVTTSSLVAISEEGSIAVIEEDLTTGIPKIPDQVGVIEGGIAAAKWHPDNSCIVIFTRNNSLLCMSNQWDVIHEIEIPSIIPNSIVDLSWKGDGDLFSIVCHDSESKMNVLRIYDKDLNLTANGRHVGEGAVAVIKGVGSALYFASNGSYIAYHLVKQGIGHQIGFLEKNGLSHNSFDLRVSSTVSFLILFSYSFF